MIWGRFGVVTDSLQIVLGTILGGSGSKFTLQPVTVTVSCEYTSMVAFIDCEGFLTKDLQNGNHLFYMYYRYWYCDLFYVQLKEHTVLPHIPKVEQQARDL